MEKAAEESSPGRCFIQTPYSDLMSFRYLTGTSFVSQTLLTELNFCSFAITAMSSSTFAQPCSSSE